MYSDPPKFPNKLVLSFPLPGILFNARHSCLILSSGSPNLLNCTHERKWPEAKCTLCESAPAPARRPSTALSWAWSLEGSSCTSSEGRERAPHGRGRPRRGGGRLGLDSAQRPPAPGNILIRQKLVVIRRCRNNVMSQWTLTVTNEGNGWMMPASAHHRSLRPTATGSSIAARAMCHHLHRIELFELG